jgi:rhodanese-related sulfurtransferase
MAISLSAPAVVARPDASRAAIRNLDTPTRFDAIEGHPALAAAHRIATARGLGYAGDVSPRDAHELVQLGAARLVDVRTAEERKFVGYVPDSIHVPWATGTSMQPNPRFSRELEAAVRKDEILLLLCRCGPRSVFAATAATRAQFRFAFNVLEGFEGDLDEQSHRGTLGGWRYYGLPWTQG